MADKDNISIWEKHFQLDTKYKCFNSTFNCDEYSSSCPDCGGKDRVSVFAEENPILAQCWGENEGRSGCGKRFYRKDYLQSHEVRSEQAVNKVKQSSITEKELQERKEFIENAHHKLFGKGYEPAYLFAKTRGFSSELMEKFKLGATFDSSKGFGLVLPVFNPSLYYQVRWMQWDETKTFSKYQNPKGKKVSPAIFSNSSEITLVFESLIDAMLVHEVTGYTTLAAMGASLRDQDLAHYEEVFIVPDQDEAGNRQFGLKGTYKKIALPKGYKDVGKLIEKKGLELTGLYLKNLINHKLKSPIKTKENEENLQDQNIQRSTEISAKENTPEKRQIISTTASEVTEPALLKYQYITTKEEAEKAVILLEKSQGQIALDTETTGLDFQNEKIRLVQLYEPAVGCFLFDLFEIEEINFLKLLEEKEFIIHYAPFDIKFLRKNGIIFKNYHDTKMLASLISPLPNPKEEGRNNLEMVPRDFLKRDFSLKGLLKAYLEIDIPKEKYVRTGWLGKLSDEKLTYAMKDVIYLHELYNRLKCEAKQNGIERVYGHYKAALSAHIEIEWVGAPIRKEALLQKIKELDPLNSCLDFIEKYGIDNPNSSKQLSVYTREMFPDIGLPKTKSGEQVKLDIYTLKEVKDKHPFFSDLYTLKKQTTSHRDHKKLYDSISPVSKRVHPTFMILSASSGRTISSNPNFQGQNIKVKSFVGQTHQKNMKITTADYSQQELRVFSLITKNKDFIELLERGEDVYKALASSITGKDPKEISDEERKPFKTTTLALLYGQGINSLSERLSLEYEQIKNLYQDIKNRLNLSKLQKNLHRCQQNKYYIPTFFINGIRPIRDKWKTLKEYQLINYCIQGTASNIGILALNYLKETIPESVNVIGYIHDEFLLEHEESQTEEVQEIVSNAMEKAFLDCFPAGEKQRKYLVDIKTGDRWIK